MSLLSALHCPLAFLLSNNLHFAKTSSFLGPTFLPTSFIILFYFPLEATKLARVREVYLKFRLPFNRHSFLQLETQNL
jgi:hypothetical protein